LRIDYRQFVGDVEWLACAESSSGWWRFDGEIVEECFHIDGGTCTLAVNSVTMNPFGAGASARARSASRMGDVLAAHLGGLDSLRTLASRWPELKTDMTLT